MSGIRLIDELTCCRNQNTTTLQYCVEAEENCSNQALHAVPGAASSIRLPVPTDRFYYPGLLHGWSLRSKGLRSWLTQLIWLTQRISPRS